MALTLLLHGMLIGGTADVIGGSDAAPAAPATLTVRTISPEGERESARVAAANPQRAPDTSAVGELTAEESPAEESTAGHSARTPRLARSTQPRTLARPDVPRLADARAAAPQAGKADVGQAGTPAGVSPATADAAHPSDVTAAALGMPPPRDAPEPATSPPILVAGPPAEPLRVPMPRTRGDNRPESVSDAALLKTVAGPSTAEAEVAVPVYRAQMPPPVSLHYDMRRGMFSGSGELSWKRQGDHYDARLEGRVAGLLVITQASSGSIDEHGIAPLRYTDTRIRRATVAANFQRDKGKITYSGPQVEFPLVEGAQDRLSWMIQIGAVLNAQPQLASPGGRITFFVTGARGDADVWTFRYVGADDVRADDGTLHAVRFTREPRRPYDSLVEVWLSPQRHYLPVRARVTADSSDEVFELVLRGMRFP